MSSVLGLVVVRDRVAVITIATSDSGELERLRLLLVEDRGDKLLVPGERSPDHGRGADILRMSLAEAVVAEAVYRIAHSCNLQRLQGERHVGGHQSSSSKAAMHMRDATRRHCLLRRQRVLEVLDGRAAANVAGLEVCCPTIG